MQVVQFVQVAVDLDAFPHAPQSQVEYAGDETQVLKDGQVFVERELLGHIAHLQAQFLGFLGHAAAENGCLPRGRHQQSAQEPHRRGLAGAVRAQETEDAAARDVEIEIAYRGYRTEAARQAAAGNGEIVIVHLSDGKSTSTGCPTGRSPYASSLTDTFARKASRLRSRWVSEK